MKCPNCNETLLMSERNNIEIDYCPSCRGVWLDKGELDKMLDYAAKNTAPTNSNQNQDDDDDYYDNDRKNYHSQNQQKPRKKRGFLGDLFEFD